MAQATTDPKQLLREYTAMWNERQYDRIPDLVTESFELYEPAIPEGKHSRDGMREFLEAIVVSFPDFRVTPTEVLASEDVIMAEADYRLTHEGESFNGVPPSGNTVEMKTMETLRIADGKVDHHQIYYDQLAFMGQLGMDPSTKL